MTNTTQEQDARLAHIELTEEDGWLTGRLRAAHTGDEDDWIDAVHIEGVGGREEAERLVRQGLERALMTYDDKRALRGGE